MLYSKLHSRQHKRINIFKNIVFANQFFSTVVTAAIYWILVSMTKKKTPLLQVESLTKIKLTSKNAILYCFYLLVCKLFYFFSFQFKIYFRRTKYRGANIGLESLAHFSTPPSVKQAYWEKLGALQTPWDPEEKARYTVSLIHSYINSYSMCHTCM